MEFRSNFFISIAINFCWIFLQLWLIQIFFLYTDNLAGWSRAEVFFLVGLFRTSKGFFDIFFRQNLFDFPEQIVRGDLDGTLTKPVNSLFITSLRYHVVSEISSPICGVGILIYSLSLLHVSLTIDLVVKLLILLPLCLLTYYSIFALFVTLAFFITRLTAVKEFNEVVSQIVRFPMDVITKGNQTLEIIFLPLILFLTYPTKIILNKLPSQFLFLDIFLTFLLLISVVKFWNFAIRHYSSASS